MLGCVFLLVTMLSDTSVCFHRRAPTHMAQARHLHKRTHTGTWQQQQQVGLVFSKSGQQQAPFQPAKYQGRSARWETSNCTNKVSRQFGAVVAGVCALSAGTNNKWTGTTNKVSAQLCPWLREQQLRMRAAAVPNRIQVQTPQQLRLSHKLETQQSGP